MQPPVQRPGGRIGHVPVCLTQQADEYSFSNRSGMSGRASTRAARDCEPREVAKEQRASDEEVVPNRCRINIVSVLLSAVRIQRDLDPPGSPRDLGVTERPSGAIVVRPPVRSQRRPCWPVPGSE